MPASTTPTDNDIEAGKPSPTKPKRRMRFWYTDSPAFMAWLRHCWPDLLVQLLCCVAALLIWKLGKPLLPRYFPLFRGIQTTPWGLKYGQPLRKEYVTTLVSGLSSFFVPFFVIGAIAIWKVGPFWDSHNALIGLGHALCAEALCIALIKWMIGGLRPHFLAVCNPVIPPPYSGIGPHPHIWFKPDEVCRASKSRLKEVQYSFPSGHSSAAFAGFGYLALYINAKYKVFADREDLRSTRVWKLMWFLLPCMVAILMSASKIRDGWHHVSDVVGGSLIGYACAHMAYRMMYRGVWDGRVNHIPRV